MSAAFSGPSKFLGRSMRNGIQAHFAEINRTGGVHGRPLRLIALDDGYDPSTAEHQVRRLIDEFEVLALIGNVGTPTTLRTAPIAREHRVLLFAPVTGADRLRPAPPQRYLMHFRASYDEEMQAIVEAILDSGIHPQRIAFMIQDDDFGVAGHRAALAALESRGFDGGERLPVGRYPRNTLDVEQALTTLMDADPYPRAFILVATSAASARFIRLVHTLYAEARIFALSFTGAARLARELSDHQRSVYMSQVVPPLGTPLSVIADYRRAMAALEDGPAEDFISLEGYLAARILVQGLERAGPEADRETLVDAMESLDPQDIGLGFPLTLGPGKHQASHRVWMARINGGEVTDAADILHDKDGNQP